MKSLSEYIQILRESATNLNLHGESVEMIVQMLANSLYISEVEHIAYSQEASLERASLENSKIQHCADQMYSVYRGANPRVIMKIKATKLFEFNLHDEIIRSNTFRVYYSGYFDGKEIVNSPCIVYPDSYVVIQGILSATLTQETWNVTVKNTYYHDIPVSNLSSDLYLKYGGEQVELTRIFSDHIRNNLYFDLTLPGYGCRIYYPEDIRSSLPGETNYFDITIYDRLLLEDIGDSEKKNLKITGGNPASFTEGELDALKAKETYPGLIYIPETDRDGIESLHHKANKNRFSGTFMVTNSDLSWILGEYYPGKIRTGGTTYRFTAPESSRIEALSETKTPLELTSETSFLNLEVLSHLADKWIDYDLGYIPPGKIKLQTRKLTENTGLNASYDIISDNSIITASETNFYKVSTGSMTSTRTVNVSPTTLYLSVLRNVKGNSTLYKTVEEIWNEGMRIKYKFTNGDYEYLDEINSDLKILIDGSSKENEALDIYLVSRNVNEDPDFTEKVYDHEIIPYIYVPLDITSSGTTTEYTSTGTRAYYGFDIVNDTVYLQSTDDGFVISPANTKATLYYNGASMTGNGCTYSYYPVSNVDIEVNAETGDITVNSIDDDIMEAQVAITAAYNGITKSSILTIKKTASNLSDKDLTTGFKFFADSDFNHPVYERRVSEGIEDWEFEVLKNRYKSLTIKREGEEFEFTDSRFDYNYDIISNVYKPSEIAIPTLSLYYIPYSESNLLTTSEISDFIEKNKSYYITQNIEVSPGSSYVAVFNINLDLYKNATLDQTVLDILKKYEYQFGVNFVGDTLNEIKSLITKISEVKNVNTVDIQYFTPGKAQEISYDEIKDSIDVSYFEIECNITSTIKS